MPEAKKGRGCFFYGCITLMILVVIAAVAILIGVRYGYKYARDHFTSTKPLTVPPLALSTNEGARVTQRVDDFRKGVVAGTAKAPLELTSDELDYYVRSSNTNGLNDNIHLTIVNDHVHAQMSIPLDMQGPSFFGRFFNGEADVPLKLENGTLSFQLKNPRVNGQPPPGWLLRAMNQNLQWNPVPGDGQSGGITNIDKIEIKDDKLILYPKTK